jgi:hypothetical protein
MIHKTLYSNQIYYKFDKTLTEDNLDQNKIKPHPEWEKWYSIDEDYQIEFLLKFSDDIDKNYALIVQQLMLPPLQHVNYQINGKLSGIKI